MGLDKKFRQSLQSHFFLALPPAPDHPCLTCRRSLTFVEEDGHGNALDKSWINTRKSHSVSYRCLKNWKNWYRTPTLTKESLETVIDYHTKKVPELERLEELERRLEEEMENEKKKKLSQPLWPRLQHPGTETQGGIVKSDSRAVIATSNVPRMSVSMSAVMFHGNRSRTRKMEKDRKKEKSRCPLGCCCYWCCEDWRRGRSTSDDPPKSKSISAMIPGPRSHTHKVEEDGKKEKENERSKPSRASEAQPLQQPGTETTGNIVRSYVSALTTSTFADAHGLPTSTFPATTSDTWSSKHLSTTPPRKWLVLRGHLEVPAMARFGVLSRNIGMCDAHACKCF